MGWMDRTSCTSGSRGTGTEPVAVSSVSSVTEAVEAPMVGASLVPLMVTVRVLVAVPPCPSLTV